MKDTASQYRVKYLEAKVNRLECRLAEVERELSASQNNTSEEEQVDRPVNKLWRAEPGYTYWTISAEGIQECYDYGIEVDDNNYEIGNYFKTKEDALFEQERLKVLKELKDWSQPYTSRGTHVLIPYIAQTFDVSGTMRVTSVYAGDVEHINLLHAIYFESEEIAKKAIEVVGEERILKYYFGYPS